MASLQGVRPAPSAVRVPARLVTCNSSSNSDRPDTRVRYQHSKEATSASPSGFKAGLDAAKAWQSTGVGPRRQQGSAQVVEPLPTGSIDDPNFNSAPPALDPDELSRTVRAVVLAGGETRNPLTRYRAMPAVPLGSTMLMIDVPLNACLKAGINKIYVLTQFQSHTLNSHISRSYPPVRFGGPDKQAWVDVLAAQQTVTEKEWYLGSADAIRKNIGELKDEARGISPATDYVILSGAAVYNMDITRMIAEHRRRNADITIAMHPCSEEVATTKGIAKVHRASCKVLKFEEKPDKEHLASMRRDPGASSPGAEYLANMGIYVFKREALFKLLSPSKARQMTHIGHHLLPNALAQEMKVYAYQYDGYWQDVSGLKDFYRANLDLAAPDEDKVFALDGMISARGSMLPPAIMHDVNVEAVVVGDGAVLTGCTVKNSVVGECVYIGRGSHVEDALLLGNAVWMSDSLRAEAIARGERVYGVGENCELRHCVIDENTTIGNNVKILNNEGIREADNADKGGYMIQDGIVVVMRNAIIPDGTII